MEPCLLVTFTTQIFMFMVVRSYQVPTKPDTRCVVLNVWFTFIHKKDIG